MNNKMKTTSVYVFIDSLESGGAQKQAILLAKGLQAYYKVGLIIYFGERIHKSNQILLERSGVVVIKLAGGHLAKIFGLYKLLRHNRDSILFSYLLLPNLIGGLVGYIAGIKWRFGGIRNSRLLPKKEWIERLIHNYINKGTIFNCRSGIQHLTSRGFIAPKAYFIPNCIEDIPSVLVKKDKPEIWILSIGRFTLQKDYFTALNSIKILNEKNIKIKYKIIGWGELKDQIGQWIHEMNLDSTVEILDESADAATWLEKADVFLMTSLYEGFPNAVMEAMAFSLPVVATNVGDCKELVLSGKSGFLIEPGDSIAIADALMTLINNQSLRYSFGEVGAQKLQREYSFDLFVNRYRQFIELNCK